MQFSLMRLFVFTTIWAILMGIVAGVHSMAQFPNNMSTFETWLVAGFVGFVGVAFASVVGGFIWFISGEVVGWLIKNKKK